MEDEIEQRGDKIKQRDEGGDEIEALQPPPRGKKVVALLRGKNKDDGRQGGEGEEGTLMR